MDGPRYFATVGTDAEPAGWSQGKAITVKVAFLLAIGYFIIGQGQQLGPKCERGGCHGTPSSAGDLPTSLVSSILHYTHQPANSPRVAQSQFPDRLSFGVHFDH